MRQLAAAFLPRELARGLEFLHFRSKGTKASGPGVVPVIVARSCEFVPLALLGERAEEFGDRAPYKCRNSRPRACSRDFANVSIPFGQEGRERGRQQAGW